MAENSYFKNLKNDIISFRHDLHKIPELAFNEFKTSKYLKDKFESFGYEVFEGFGKTGLVARLKKGSSDKSVAFRSDIDSIAVDEIRNLDYKSSHKGRMHACGHDGHMATMLGAAKIIADKIDFDGYVYFIMQPAEEPGHGAKAMIDDGLFEKFKIDQIYGFHNVPGLKEGSFHTKNKGILASEDNFIIDIKARGGHASTPNLTIDPMVIAANIILSLQTIVSRNANPVDTAVVSVTEIKTDGAHNAIPSNVRITGDTRTFKTEVSDLIEKRMKELVENITKAYGAGYEFSYTHEFYPTINHKECVEIASKAGENILGEENVDKNCDPMMFSEDFAYYLNEIPGCFSLVGSKKDDGKEVRNLHNNEFDYNDDILLDTARVFAEIARLSLGK